MKYRNTTMSLLIYCLVLELSALISSPPALARETSTTEVIVTGNFLKLDPENPGEYKIETQWPIAYLGQWVKILEAFPFLQETPEMHNPVLEKEDSIIVLTQSNPDQISGEDVYFSPKGYILRISRSPIDTLYSNAGDLYEFLQKELQKQDKNYNEKAKDIAKDESPIVVVFHGSQMLGNPSWEITDPSVLEIYKNEISSLKKLQITSNIEITKQSIGKEFEEMNTFSIYMNYPGAPANMILVGKYGKARSSRIQMIPHCYKDEQNYYKVLRKQASDTIENERRIERMKQQSDLENRF